VSRAVAAQQRRGAGQRYADPLQPVERAGPRQRHLPRERHRRGYLRRRELTFTAVVVAPPAHRGVRDHPVRVAPPETEQSGAHRLRGLDDALLARGVRMALVRQNRDPATAAPAP